MPSARIACSLSLAASLIAAASASAQVTNGGFDVGFVASSGQAEVPLPWTSSSPGSSVISFDTWDDTGGNGLLPSFAGVFTGVTAQSGTRWAGGWNFEDMSQPLSFTLTPGQQYTVSAWVHTADTTIGYVAGGWRFGLGANQFATPTILATFPATATWAGGWTFQSATFIAPPNAASLPYFFPQVYKTGSLNTYMGIDDVAIHATPTPASAALLGLGGLVGMRRRRHS